MSQAKHPVKRISSRLTVVNKKVFPAVWFGFLAVFFVTSLATGAVDRDIMFLVVPVVLAVFGYALMKKVIWDLADEVYDCGDFLLVRMRGEEERVQLTNVTNVNSSTFTNPPRITLRLASPSRFGGEVTFSPISGRKLNPFTKNAIAEDLIVRVDLARSRRAV